MATPAQIQANRLNSLKSTGPTSVEGKDATRFNALKHGADAQSLVIPGEDPAEFADLAASYRDHYHPQGPVEQALLQTIIHADWNLRRYTRLETQLFQTLIANAETPSPTPLGAAFLHDAAGANALQKLFRRQQAAQRDWKNSLAELRRLQEERLLAAARPAPKPIPALHPVPAAIPSVTAHPVPAKGANWLGSEPPEWRL